MLTPPRRDSSPCGDRVSGYRICYTPDQKVSNLLFKLAGSQMGELRLYGYSEGRQDFVKRLSACPSHVSLQTFNNAVADGVESKLRSLHQERGDGAGPFIAVSLRYIEAWEFYDTTLNSFSNLNRRLEVLERDFNARARAHGSSPGI